MAHNCGWPLDAFLRAALPNDALLRASSPNDPGILTEIQCFSRDEPIFQVSTVHESTISAIALAVVRWLQVCLILRHSSSVLLITALVFSRYVMIHLKKRYYFGKAISRMKTTSSETPQLSHNGFELTQLVSKATWNVIVAVEGRLGTCRGAQRESLNRKRILA